MENQQQAYLSEEISFKEILINTIRWFSYILSKWIFITGLAVVGGIAGFLHANSNPVKYIAVSTFVLQEMNTNNVQGNDFVSALGFNVPEAGGLFQGENLLQLYKTRFMIKKTLLNKIPETNETLVERYLKINGLTKATQLDKRLKNLNFLETNNKQIKRIQDSLMNLFYNDIKYNYLIVNKQERLNIISIEVKSTNEEFAKLFNDMIVKTVNDFYIETKTKRAKENLTLLKRQTDSIRAALNGAMYRIAVASEINLNPARAVQRLPSQKSQVTSETNRAMLNELVRDLEVSKMSLRRETPLIQLMDEPVFPLEKIRESRAKGIIMGSLLLAGISIVIFSGIYLVKKILQ